MSSADENTNGSSDDQISLEDLSDAFARMLDSGDGDAESPPQETDHQAAVAEDAEADTDADEETCPITPQSILEAMLFVGHPLNEPLTCQQAATAIHGAEPSEIPALIDELNSLYAEESRPFEVASDGAGYRLILRPSFQRVRDRFYGRVREARLSQAAIEVLALVAYNQPVTSKEISDMRGHPSGAILAQLVRRELLRMERPEQKPRTPKYHTTDRFLDLFGLQSLEDLPQTEATDEA